MYVESTSTPETAPDTRGRLVPKICSVSITAQAEAGSVGLLRRRSSALFAGWAMSADGQSSAALVISELLTNAVMHGLDEMTLTIALMASELEITVTDHGKGPSPKNFSTPSDPDEHGRGLAIVAGLTRSLSIDQTVTGWCARARMDVTFAVPAAALASNLRLRAA